MKTHISKELALWLKERWCEIETKVVYWEVEVGKWILVSNGDFAKGTPLIPAYSWYDILVNKEFWKDEPLEFTVRTKDLLQHLQRCDFEKAEAYVREHSLFNKPL